MEGNGPLHKCRNSIGMSMKIELGANPLLSDPYSRILGALCHLQHLSRLLLPHKFPRSLLDPYEDMPQAEIVDSRSGTHA